MAELIVPVKYSEVQEEIFFPTEEQGFPKITHVRKGRRLGLTQGAAHAFYDYGMTDDKFNYWFLPATGPLYFMWGDTINSNIYKYVDRFFMPLLRATPQKMWHWDRTNKTMKIGRAIIDFRSADKPENWEGFGYHIIFLNEAGIILEDNYLYENAVLPMMMDYPEARLLAAGVPKGKRTKDGVHKFYDIYEKGLKDKKRYRLLKYSSYDTPFLRREDIDLVADVIDPEVRKQEIYGEFIDLNEKAYFYMFKEEKHVIEEYIPTRGLPLLISFDFNKEPCTAIVAQKPTFNSLVIFDEIEINNGSTPEVIEELKVRYPEYRLNMEVTGDASGNSRTSMIKGNVNHYTIISEELELDDEQLLVPDVNPSHSNSRVFCNALWNKANARITKNCKKTIADCIFSFVDANGELVKTKEEGRHFFDNVRYILHAAFDDFLDNPGKYLITIKPKQNEQQRKKIKARR